MMRRTWVFATAATFVLGVTVIAQQPQQPAEVGEGGGPAMGGRVPTTITTEKVARVPVKTVKTEVPIERAVRQETSVFKGEGLFIQRCAPCHRGDWRKDGQMKAYAPPLTGVLQNVSPARENGVKNFIRFGTASMPGFANTFTPAEFDALFDYLKTL